MSLETMIYFGVSGLIVLMILRSLLSVLMKFVELSEKLSCLIEVTYEATHNPDFGAKINNNVKEKEETTLVQ